MAISINAQELRELLESTPADQNIMLAGKHGIGKSQILTEYFVSKGMKVVALFLGQMSDPGDLIGLPNKDQTTGKTEFMPPYWFPVDGQPVVLFLDELNRARPEVLQTIMDLALNRKLAGRVLPEGSRIISAVNDGEEYQLTDLDPALVSRFNIYSFRPSSEDWLLWAQKSGVDARVIGFIQNSPAWLDGNEGETVQMDAGLEKTPDRRGWKKVSDAINGRDLQAIDKKIIAGIVGVKAANAFVLFTTNMKMVSGADVLADFAKVEQTVMRYELHQLSQLNDSVYRTLEVGIEDKAVAGRNLKKYVQFLSKNNREAMAHFTSVVEHSKYPKAVAFLCKEVPEVYQEIMMFIAGL